ncbi:hypothetical protein LA5096_06225 [Roseibium album]|uniref:Uncharacterized protein n=2 Tax=Roseibium album TaxID=311410 RepID=A0A0M7AYF1_9HYPH|nr:hypothetical protein LA5096_06225 [Roseibium album]
MYEETKSDRLPAKRRGRPARKSGDPPSSVQQRRLVFIERALLWTGRVSRRAISTTFDVSMGHVSQDFQVYRKLAPSNLEYDLSSKCYTPSAAFQPVFCQEDPADILGLIASTAALPLQERTRVLGFSVACESLQTFPSGVQNDVLVDVLRAITSASAISVDYQSMNTPKPVTRVFWPHALIFSGHRWLTRGWDVRHNEYRDFAIGRILHSEKSADDRVLTRDNLWHDRIDIEFAVADRLSPTQAEVTAREFGMTRENGAYALRVNARKAMIPYLLDYWRIRPGSGETQAIPLCIENYSAINAYDRRDLSH